MIGDMNMKLDRLSKITTATTFAIILLISGGMILGTTAQAQDRDHDQSRQRDRNDRQDQDHTPDRPADWDHYGDRNEDSYRRGFPTYPSNVGPGRSGGGYAYRNIAGQNGYSAGLKRGADDARRGRSYNPNNPSQYRKGDNGYHSEYGNKDAYRAAYRDGFLRGYEQAYRQSAGYGYGRR
jgi:hypothetical protein